MGFPTATETGGFDNNNFLTRTITLPSAADGDLLIVCVSNDDSTDTQTWTHDQGFTDWVDGAASGHRMVVKYIVAGATFDTSLVVDTSTSEQCSWSILRIPAGTYSGVGAGNLEETHTSTSGTTVSPDNLAPSWGSSDTLWLALLSLDVSTTSPTNTPSGYTMGTYRRLNNNQAVGVQWGWQAIAAASEDPGDWTFSVSRSVQLLTGAIRGTGAATDADAGLASGTGVAQTASASVAVSAGLGSGTGTAFDATVSTAVTTNAPAGLASGTGASNQPSPAIAVSAGLAAGTGTSYDATVSTSASTNAAAGLAAGTGASNQPSIAIAVNAGNAAGTGAAANASVTTSTASIAQFRVWISG